ncbi:uncharacterized protein ACA1_339370 [Acanthamoeba castellanii str. Neff]|uniref:Uncharacterized protein n=1 Tax=Acanthamoeba castellanii (strain ATCC 30010 / Neff) TaxID=1257118 RepID=L8HB26_ACACF|nr:uncharacterized protein ACA1_339370 [Acanthamoeba castellanii str. Neff]ELR22714.1 hypothetical protein ACA1_339370 [Acanthamoeba castellanii str. Neff]
MEKAQQKEASQDNDSADFKKAQETTKRKEPDGPILKGDTTDHDPPGSKRRQLSSDDFIEAKEEAGGRDLLWA